MLTHPRFEHLVFDGRRIWLKDIPTSEIIEDLNRLKVRTQELEIELEVSDPYLHVLEGQDNPLFYVTEFQERAQSGLLEFGLCLGDLVHCNGAFRWKLLPSPQACLELQFLYDKQEDQRLSRGAQTDQHIMELWCDSPEVEPEKVLRRYLTELYCLQRNAMTLCTLQLQKEPYLVWPWSVETPEDRTGLIVEGDQTYRLISLKEQFAAHRQELDRVGRAFERLETMVNLDELKVGEGTLS